MSCTCTGCTRCTDLAAARAAARVDGLEPEPEPFVGMTTADLAVPTVYQVGRAVELKQGGGGRSAGRPATARRTQRSARGGKRR